MRSPWFSSGPQRSVAVAGLLVLVGLPSLAAPEPRPLATYRTSIHERDLESWLTHGGAVGGQDSAGRAKALEQLVLVTTLAQEAIRLELDRRPETRVELARAEGELALGVLRRLVNASIEVSDAEVEATFEEIRDSLGLPKRVRLRNLFKRIPSSATAADKERLRLEMRALRQRALDGADFSELAAAESHSHTRLQGGLIGNVRPGTLRPSMDRVAMAMKPGDVSAVLEEEEGLTLLYCEEVLPPLLRSPEEGREIARSRLERARWRERWGAMEQHLLDEAQVRWHWAVLEPEAPPIDGAAVLLEHLGGELTALEVGVIAAPRASLPELAGRDREQIRRRVEPFVRQRLAVRELAVRGLGDEELDEKRRWSRQRILAAKALAELVGRRLEPVRDADARALYDAEPDRFRRPAHYRLRVIALPFERRDPRPAYDLALGLVADLDSGGADFAELARRHSVDRSGEQGGEVGWLSVHALPRRLGIDVTRAVKRLAAGQRSRWIRDDEDGLLWLAELHEREEPRTMTWDEARQRARQIVGQRQTDALKARVTREWLETLELRQPGP